MRTPLSTSVVRPASWQMSFRQVKTMKPSMDKTDGTEKKWYSLLSSTHDSFSAVKPRLPQIVHYGTEWCTIWLSGFCLYQRHTAVLDSLYWPMLDFHLGNLLDNTPTININMIANVLAISHEIGLLIPRRSIVLMSNVYQIVSTISVRSTHESCTKILCHKKVQLIQCYTKWLTCTALFSTRVHALYGFANWLLSNVQQAGGFG